jgi:hypothetical protein
MKPPKAKAIDLLAALLERARALPNPTTDDPIYKLWRRETEITLRNLFGEGSVQFKSFARITFFSHYLEPSPSDNLQAFKSNQLSAVAYLEALVTEVREFWEDLQPPPPAPAPTPSALDTVLRIADRLPDGIRRLRIRREGRDPLLVEDEFDLQYVLGAVLAIHFDDVRPEEPGPSAIGASSRVDYLLKAERTMVETKMTRNNLGAKGVGEELIVDIRRYEAREDCDALVCVVYDPEHRIPSPRGLERELEATQTRLRVRVLIRS